MQIAELTPIEMMYKWEQRFPSMVFVKQSLGSGKWQDYTWSDIATRVRKVANFIREQGISEGSHIALWSSNSVDWIISDLAILMSGCVTVPIYPGQDIKTAKKIIGHSDAKMIFLGDFDQSLNAKDALPSELLSVAMPSFPYDSKYSLSYVYENYDSVRDSPVYDGKSLFSLIYSSGTTGDPKGVMINNETPGICCPKVLEIIKHRPYTGDDTKGRGRFISYLPLAHIAERLLVFLVPLYSNSLIYISKDRENFSKELFEAQPTFFFSVPRLWTIFKASVDEQVPPENMPHLDDKTKFSIRERLGFSKLKFVISGSAALPEETLKWYYELGVPIRDAYGMTETMGIGTLWRSDENPPSGCVGSGDELFEIKVAEDDEILLRTPALMAGYYKDTEKTKEVISDGWYHTGDCGRLDGSGNLWITGRKGDVFKTQKGKFIQPQKLESLFAFCEELEQIMICGRFSENPILLANLSEKGRKLNKDELTNKLGQHLSAINIGLPAFERVKKIVVVNTLWTIENGLLTPTLKQKRNVIESQFLDILTQGNRNPQTVVFESQ